jgi:hypothetical protein
VRQGCVPPVGWALGVAQGILEHFVLDKLLKPSGVSAFIASVYPSVFCHSLVPSGAFSYQHFK